MNRRLQKKALFFACFLFVSFPTAFADRVVVLHVTPDGTLDGMFERDPNATTSDPVLGLWYGEGSCVETKPCSVCEKVPVLEFESNGVFSHWMEKREVCVSEGGEKSETRTLERGDSRSGRFRMIGRQMVELAADWKISFSE